MEWGVERVLRQLKKGVRPSGKHASRGAKSRGEERAIKTVR